MIIDTTAVPRSRTADPLRAGAREIGRVERPGPDWTLHTFTGPETVLGPVDGFASLDDAVTAARTLTLGTAPAAAVLRGNDRFFLTEVFACEPGNDELLGWYDAVGSHREQSVTFGRSDVRALVDGDVVLRAGELGTPIPVTAPTA